MLNLASKKIEVKQSYQTGQKLAEDAKIEKFKCDIFSWKSPKKEENETFLLISKHFVYSLVFFDDWKIRIPNSIGFVEAASRSFSLQLLLLL